MTKRQTKNINANVFLLYSMMNGECKKMMNKTPQLRYNTLLYIEFLIMYNNYNFQYQI